MGGEINNPNSGQWYLGDFDYSGMCDNNDVTALGGLFNPTAPALSPAVVGPALFSAQIIQPAATPLDVVAAKGTSHAMMYSPASSLPSTDAAKLRRAGRSMLSAVLILP